MKIINIINNNTYIIRSLALFIILFLSSIVTFGQHTNGQFINIVPNWDFQKHKVGGSPQCETQCCIPNREKPFNDNIEDWVQANQQNCGIGGKCATSDWFGPSCSHDNQTPPPSTRWVGMAGVHNWSEGIRVSLPENLVPGEEYVIRIRLYNRNSTEGKINIIFSDEGASWDWWGNNTIAASIETQGYQEWKGYMIHYNHPSNGATDYDNLIIIVDNSSDYAGSYTYVDQVEIYKSCPDEIRFQNRKFVYADISDKVNPYEASSKIIAGQFVLPSTVEYQSELEIKPGAAVAFKAGTAISLSKGFRAEPGSKFRAYIGPCGECTPTAVDLNSYVNLCGNSNRIQIGTYRDVRLKYSWSAVHNPGDILYLSDTKVANPYFTAPSNQAGVITYKLTITNECNEEN